MVGPTAQLAALTCYCNAHQRGIFARPFFPENSTCLFCEWIHFLLAPRKGKVRDWEVVAQTPDEWMNLLLTQKMTRASLIHKPVNDPKFADRMTAGFVGGGGQWLLCVQKQDHSDFWQAAWQVANRDAPDRRIWRVQYALVEETNQLAADRPNLSELTAQLAEALVEIEQFAREQKLDGFADCFAKAQQCLSSPTPFSTVYHKDIAPEGLLTIEAARLLAACQAAWVFGGMGSWNDLGFDGAEQLLYQRLSDHVYNLLNGAICASVNSSAIPVP